MNRLVKDLSPQCLMISLVARGVVRPEAEALVRSLILLCLLKGKNASSQFPSYLIRTNYYIINQKNDKWSLKKKRALQTWQMHRILFIRIHTEMTMHTSIQEKMTFSCIQKYTNNVRVHLRLSCLLAIIILVCFYTWQNVKSSNEVNSNRDYPLPLMSGTAREFPVLWDSTWGDTRWYFKQRLRSEFRWTLFVVRMTEFTEAVPDFILILTMTVHFK